MLVPSILLFVSFWTSAISATPMKSPNSQSINLPAALNLTTLDLLSPSNASTKDLSVSSGRGLNIQCDGAKYGFNPSLADCEGARGYFVPDSAQRTFAERHTGFSSEEVFPLPYMIMGGMLTREPRKFRHADSLIMCVRTQTNPSATSNPVLSEAAPQGMRASTSSALRRRLCS